MIKKIINKFNSWNKVKQDIEGKETKKFLHIKPREIWYINIWKNIWFESDWKNFNFKRPILVLKIVGSLVFIVSMTTKWKDNKFYYKIDNKYFNKDSYLTLSQVKTQDKKRFINKIWKIEVDDFNKIKRELSQLLL